MRPLRPFPLLPLLVALAAAPAAADPLDEAAIHAEPQYYLMSLPPAPVGEIAEAVLGEALGLPYKVDSDVDAQVGFQVDGVYGPRALAREFGYRLWNADVALIERPSDGLWLIPRSELPLALAQGAALVSPPATAEAAPSRTLPPKRAIHPAPAPGPQENAGLSWLAWLVAGWVAGVTTVLGLLALRRRRTSPAPVLLAASTPIETDPGDLVIPSFPSRAA